MAIRLPDGRYEQTFDAEHVAVDTADGAVTLAAADREYEPRHGIFVSAPEAEPFTPEDIYVEFSDQGNGCSGREVTISLHDKQLRFEYSDEVTAWVGRISYEDDDVSSDPALPLRRVVVNLKTTLEVFAAVEKELRRLQRNGVAVGVKGR